MSDAVSDEQTFAQLHIDPRIIAAVTQLGFNAPTPIQAKAIPPLLEGRDLVGRARTGSGKTAAFGLPLLDMLSRGSDGVRALVLAPTRELALQITTALRAYGTQLRLKMVTLYGGSSYQPQLSALRRGVDVVVGTPGRLRDHLDRGSLDLSNIQLVVIDEADEMLRMGFIEDLTQILQATPDTRQVALFSATMPAPIRKVAETYLRTPLEVYVEQGRLVVEHIEQHRIDVPEGYKIETLVRVLKSKAAGATLIFARTRVTCDELAESLRDRGFQAQALHGNMTQSAREEVLGSLRTRRLELVVATDVAARGIDVEHLTHVINFDMPEEVEVYVNRIGRTGRAGRKGMAISLVARRDLSLLRRIEQQTRSQIGPRPVPSDAQVVSRQRADLEADLKAALQHQNKDNATALLGALQQGEWTAESLTTAALGLLMQDRHLDIEAAPSEETPLWARRTQRPAKATLRGRPGGPRVSRSRTATNQATFGVTVGREDGIGPSDVVGALANELRVPAQAIGQITILDHHLTVALSEEGAAHLARNPKTVYLRGKPVTFARPDDGSAPERSKRRPPSSKPPSSRPPSKRTTSSRPPSSKPPPKRTTSKPTTSTNPRPGSTSAKDPPPAAAFYLGASTGKRGKGRLDKKKVHKGRQGR